MLPNYNNTKEFPEIGINLGPINLVKNNSSKTISTQISLESKKSFESKIKLSEPVESPEKEVKINLSNEKPNLNYEIKLNNSSKPSDNNGSEFKEGKWTDEEHEKFIEGILIYGNEWKKVQEIIKTRSSEQARSHGQKFFKRFKDLIKKNEEKHKRKKKEKIFETVFKEMIPTKNFKNLTQNQKEKLLSAINCGIKVEKNNNQFFNFSLGLEENENNENINNTKNVKTKNNNNKNNKNVNNKKGDDEDGVYVKNNKICFDLNILNKEGDLLLSNNIGKKRKKGKKGKNNDIFNEIFLSGFKDKSHRSSFDFNFSRINEKENEDINNYSFNFGLGDNDLCLKNGNNQESMNKSYISSKNTSSFANSNVDNLKGKYIINNVINVTNNYINKQLVYNFVNNEMINNNCNKDLDFNDKNDSINNERNQFNFGNFQTQEKYCFNDKANIDGNQFNKIFNDNFIDINSKYNNFNENEYENKNENINHESDPFQLNFNSFSNDNIVSNENEREMTNHENDFIKLSANN